MWQNLFLFIGNIILIIFGIWLVYLMIMLFIQFVFIDVVWIGENWEVCLLQDGGYGGVCWVYVEVYLLQFIYGWYLVEECYWVDIVYVLFVLLLVLLVIFSVFFKKFNVILFLVVFLIIFYFLLIGLVIGDLVILLIVEIVVWGGFLVMLVIVVMGIVVLLLFGIVFVLGWCLQMLIIKLVLIIFIEFWCGVLLIIVLFMLLVMLLLFLLEGVIFDKLLCVLIGVMLFFVVYMVEVVCGGLQVILKGQYEGVMVLGLCFWLMMYFIILLQVFKLVILGIVNIFIGLFKDMILVLIVGMFDFFGQIQFLFMDLIWLMLSQGYMGYLFVVIIFFVFCFGMLCYFIFMENKLYIGYK